MKLELGVLIALIGFTSCTRGGPPEITAGGRPSGFLPSKDELWSSEGTSFSASEFEALQERFPPLTAESRLRLSQYLSLYPSLLKEGRIPKSVSVEQYAEDLRGLLKPAPSGSDPALFQKKIAELYGAESASAWQTDLDRRVKARHFEWNPTLLQEYGLKP